MDLDEIRQILDMMREHELAEFELERDNIKLRLRKNVSSPSMPALPPAAFAPASMPIAAATAAATPSNAAAAMSSAAASEDVDLAIMKSPIVGTFYRSSEPGAAPFVDIGHTVRKGQVLCIIEAMKLMNEINAECDGDIIKIYVDNGQAVQYGERLFAIRPAS
jgi:acetyl-CoA carboxylase biotin carboxyl carrier protein